MQLTSRFSRTEFNFYNGRHVNEVKYVKCVKQSYFSTQSVKTLISLKSCFINRCTITPPAKKEISNNFYVFFLSVEENISSLMTFIVIG